MTHRGFLSSFDFIEVATDKMKNTYPDIHHPTFLLNDY